MFYDSTNATGKFVFDDASAIYTGISAKKSTTEKIQTPPKKSGSVMQFGKPRKKLDASNTPNTTNGATVDETRTSMQYQQRNMVEEVFHSMYDKDSFQAKNQRERFGISEGRIQEWKTRKKGISISLKP